METVKDSDVYKGLAEAIETYMKYRNPDDEEPFVFRMSHSCAEALLKPLKEQEPIAPKKQEETCIWTVCGNCSRHLISMWAYCPYCGRKVKRDD